MTLQSLLNKRVITADGACLGRIYDFRARREGPNVVVTHLRVGVAAWGHRLHLHGVLRWLLSAAQEMDIPWEAIAAVGTHISLKPGWDCARCEGYLIRGGREA